MWQHRYIFLYQFIISRTFNNNNLVYSSIKINAFLLHSNAWLKSVLRTCLLASCPLPLQLTSKLYGFCRCRTDVSCKVNVNRFFFVYWKNIRTLRLQELETYIPHAVLCYGFSQYIEALSAAMLANTVPTNMRAKGAMSTGEAAN